MKERSVEVVVARYDEDLEWILKLPEHIRIVLYNKGEPVENPDVIARIGRLERRRNFGRESETFLHHLKSSKPVADGFTVFTQGDPFEHSPDFLKLLANPQDWQPVQSLSVRWMESRQIPPEKTLESDPGESPAGFRARSEFFSLHTLGPLHFVDGGAILLQRDYLSSHVLENGDNLVAHFLRLAGWDDLAAEAEASDFGQFSYGGIFAIRNDRYDRIPPDVLERLLIMTRSNPVHGFVFERLWLHIFGVPFHGKLVRQNA